MCEADGLVNRFTGTGWAIELERQSVQGHTLPRMTAGLVDPEETARQARRRMEADVDTRVDAVRTLAEAARHANQSEQAAQDSRTAHTDAWNAALAAGWKDKDLRAIGVRSPAPAPTGTRRRRNPTPSGDAPTTA